MKSHWNRVLAGTLALTMLGMTGCVQKPKSAGASVYVIVKSADPYWDTTKAGALDAGEEMDLNVTFEAPETEAELDVQIEMVEDAINAGAKAIVLAALDTDALNDTLAKAQEANIHVLTIDSDVSFEGRRACISTQNYAAGAIAARYAASLMNENGNLAIISHSETAQTALERVDGFTDEINGTGTPAVPNGKEMRLTGLDSGALPIVPLENGQPPAGRFPTEEQPQGETQPYAKPETLPYSGSNADGYTSQTGHPEITVTETRVCNSNVQQAFEETKQLIKENPDIKLIYATNQPGTVGACQAIEELGAANTVQLVGFDYFDGADGYIESGVLDGVISQNPYNMGYLGVRYAKKLIEGNAVAESVDTGATLITAENLNDEDIRFLVNPTGK